MGSLCIYACTGNNLKFPRESLKFERNDIFTPLVWACGGGFTKNWMGLVFETISVKDKNYKNLKCYGKTEPVNSIKIQNKMMKTENYQNLNLVSCY